MIPNLLLYSGAALLFGGSFSRSLLFPVCPRLRWLLVGGVFLVLGVAWQLTSVLLTLDNFNWDSVTEYLTVLPAGRAALWMLLGAFLLLAAEANRWPRWFRLSCSLLGLWGLAGMGHGAAHGAGLRLLHALHAGAMCLWLGGVGALLAQKRPDPSSALRFSPYGLISLLLLIGTGAVMSLTHLPSAEALLSTAYGRTLSFKLLLLLITVLAVLQVRKAFLRQVRVKTWLSLELFLLVAIVGVTASLSRLSPH